MSTKVKINREYTFKAYAVKNGEEVLNNVHSGEFMSKSDCHYYCEKFVLDYVKNNLTDVVKNGESFAIYKIFTLEDDKREDMLIELISVKDGVINIR